ncbi:hypothetical protein HK1_00797 [Tepidibacillus sp. HK-1]|nr:hypothetical protein HK1_00797 [Tepidibacillus sp. HK-1]
MGSTLPTWFWVVYYSFILVTLIVAIITLVERYFVRIYTIFTFIVLPAFVILVLLGSLGRQGTTELENWFIDYCK